MLAQSHKPYQNGRHTLSTWTLFGLSLHINRFACGFERSCYNLTNIYTSTTSLDFILAFVCSYVSLRHCWTAVTICIHHILYFFAISLPLPLSGSFSLLSTRCLYCGFFRRLLFELPFIFVWCRTLYLSICVLFQFRWFLLAVCRFCFFVLYFGVHVFSRSNIVCSNIVAVCPNEQRMVWYGKRWMYAVLLSSTSNYRALNIDAPVLIPFFLFLFRRIYKGNFFNAMMNLFFWFFYFNSIILFVSVWLMLHCYGYTSSG